METGLETILGTVLEILKIKRVEQQEDPMVSIGTETNLEKNSGERSDNRTRNDRNDSEQKSNKHCEYCDPDDYAWKYLWEM